MAEPMGAFTRNSITNATSQTCETLYKGTLRCGPGVS